MKKTIINQTNYTYKTFLFSLGMLLTLYSCKDVPKEETATDTLAVVTVDSPKVVKNGGGSSSVITADTTPTKIDTPAKVEVVENKPKDKPKDKPKEITENKPKDKPVVKNTVKETEPKDLVKTPEQPAMPPDNSYPGFYKFVRENLKYPEQAIKDGVEGTVRVEFIVNKDGSISHVKVVQGIGAGCDEEAIRIVKQSPKWIAGIHKGNPVTTKSLIPISFKIR
jgi:protein TonB